MQPYQQGPPSNDYYGNSPNPYQQGGQGYGPPQGQYGPLEDSTDSHSSRCTTSKAHRRPEATTRTIGDKDRVEAVACLPVSAPVWRAAAA